MIEDRLKELDIQIPIPPSPAGSYIPVVTTGNLAFVSGQIPMREGKIIFEGIRKTNKDISFAISQNIRLINVESMDELQRINSIAD